MTNPIAPELRIQRVNYLDATDAQALVALLDMYAQDPMGGATPLAAEAKARLCQDLAALPQAVSFIAWAGTQAVGLINGFEGYSTFKAQALINVHDICVLPTHRGEGIAKALLQAMEQHARERNCCKLTLEVLSGNASALRSYQAFGFAAYQLDPAAGHAVFMQKQMV